jgi:ABC-type antimicrobial peptide transport system permease subunit
MILNYLKISIRNLSRFKTFSIINVSGLSIGLACTILILLWVRDEMSFDKFHENMDNIYHVYLRVYDESKNINTQSSTSFQIASSIKDKIPEIKETIRMGALGEIVVRHENEMFNETNGMAADPSIFEIFTFPVVEGSVSDALQQPKDIIITQSFSKKYFNDMNPIGKEIIINSQYNFMVQAVIEDIPNNSHRNFEFLVPFKFLENVGHNLAYDGNLFSACRYHTYLLVNDHADFKNLNASIKENFNFNQEKVSGEYFIIPLAETYRYNLFGGDIILYVLISVATLILIIACFNYSNLSLAMSSIRNKEVGIRKVFGASRKQLISQHFGETVVYVIIAINFAILTVNFTLSEFNLLTGKNLEIQLINFDFLFLIFLILILTTLVAGGYPAIFLSKFNPGKILQGKNFNSGSKTSLRKTLIISQFTIAILFLFSAIIIDKQFYYMNHSDLGFDNEGIIYIALNKNIKSKAEEIKNELSGINGVEKISATSHLPILIAGGYYQVWGKPGREESYLISTKVDYNFLELLNIDMFKGRFFDEKYTGDKQNVVVNKKAIVELGLTNPIGEKFYYRGDYFNIVGVMEDFHHVPMVMNISPLVFFLEEKEADYILIKIDPLVATETSRLLTQIKQKWATINPDYPLIYNFLNEFKFPQEQTAEAARTLVRYFTFIAILLSCFGLFGLSTFSMLQKTKEIGIRKVMGASNITLIRNLFMEYIKMLLIANIIALPAGYFLSNLFLDAFAYKIELSFWIFILVSLSILFIALATISFQAIKTSIKNPVQTLKYE